MFVRRTIGWVGFDIGASSVKAAQVVRTDAGYRIRASAIVPRSQRWGPGAFVEDQPGSSADEISAAASLCEHLIGTNAASLLPMEVCDLLQMDVPAAKRTGDPPDLVRAIEAETQRSMRDRVFDHWPITGHSGKINVVTAPNVWSDRISADVASAGWRCRVIDGLPWALARAASLADASSNGQPIAALDWAYGKSTICLVRNGVPALVRSLKGCGYQNVIETVASSLRLSDLDAETLLQRFGVSTIGSKSSTLIDDILESPLNRLAQEIRRTLDYWRGVTRGQSPELIYLFGGGGALASVGPRLTELLGVPVKAWDLPAENEAGVVRAPHCLLGAAVGLSALAWESL